MRYSVTGTSNLSRIGTYGFTVIYDVLMDLSDPTEFTTGGAVGIDSWACAIALKIFGGTLHRLVIPAAPYNEETVAQFIEKGPNLGGRIIEFMPRVPGKRANYHYMARNDRLVEYADVLLAFPLTEEEEVRSGTWATVRRARKVGIPVEIYPVGK